MISKNNNNNLLIIDFIIEFFLKHKLNKHIILFGNIFKINKLTYVNYYQLIKISDLNKE